MKKTVWSLKELAILVKEKDPQIFNQKRNKQHAEMKAKHSKRLQRRELSIIPAKKRQAVRSMDFLDFNFLVKGVIKY
jgi:hypothetical protein